MLGVSVVLWMQGFSGSMVQWFNGSVVQWFSGSMVQWFRGGHSGPSETEVERNAMDCKRRTKTRLRSNYSYYTILIVEDTQSIAHEYKQE